VQSPMDNKVDYLRLSTLISLAQVLVSTLGTAMPSPAAKLTSKDLITITGGFINAEKSCILEVLDIEFGL